MSTETCLCSSCSPAAMSLGSHPCIHAKQIHNPKSSWSGPISFQMQHYVEEDCGSAWLVARMQLGLGMTTSLHLPLQSTLNGTRATCRVPCATCRSLATLPTPSLPSLASAAAPTRQAWPRRGKTGMGAGLALWHSLPLDALLWPCPGEAELNGFRRLNLMGPSLTWLSPAT